MQIQFAEERLERARARIVGIRPPDTRGRVPVGEFWLAWALGRRSLPWWYGPGHDHRP